VADEAPFYSIVGDLPSDDAYIDRLLEQLNENGLFRAFDQAKTYFETYRARWLEHQKVIFHIWEIYLVDWDEYSGA
jgi:hypothetical protein